MTAILVALVAMTVAVAGCADAGDPTPVVPAPSLRAGEFAVPTISPPFGSEMEACPAALTTGTLIEHPDGGLGLGFEGGDATRVRWPYGWRGTSGPPVALVDADGAVIASIGQRVEVGGGQVADDWWLGCGGVRVAD